MIINYSTSIFYLSCSHNNNLYDQLNYNLHPCNKFGHVYFHTCITTIRYTYPVTNNSYINWVGSPTNGANPIISKA